MNKYTVRFIYLSDTKHEWTGKAINAAAALNKANEELDIAEWPTEPYYSVEIVSA